MSAYGTYFTFIDLWPDLKVFISITTAMIYDKKCSCELNMNCTTLKLDLFNYTQLQLESLSDLMFIDNQSIAFDYRAYFDQCLPSSYSYKYSQQLNSLLLGLFMA